MQDIAKDILVKAQEGDIDAFEAIYKETAGFVYNVCLRLLNNKEDSQEVTQDVFVVLHQKLKSFRFESGFKTWVYRITLNRALNYARRNAKMKNNVEYNDALLENASCDGAFTEKIDSQERKRIVDGLLGAVNPKQRSCVVLRDMQGLSYAEISSVLKININTVRSRLKRARGKLLSIGKKVGYEGLQEV